MNVVFKCILILIFLLISPIISNADTVRPLHAVSVFGDIRYKQNFEYFDYVNPTAPKGGKVKIADIGTYDSLNNYILKGVPASGLDLIFETLMESSADEVGTAYGLIAESAEVDSNGNFVIFNLRKQARWHDGTPITAEDVVFSFNTIKTKGHPNYRLYYQDIEKAEELSTLKVKFQLSDPNNRELPLIISQLPVFSKKYYSKQEFDKTTLDPPLGSGPYKIKSINPGRSITYKRVQNYWGKNLPINIGRYNFDEIQIDYYRDASVAIEALKAGEYDFRRENISKTWTKSYNIPHLNDGRMIKEELPDGTPTGMQCFIFNLRKPLFQDIRLREALNYAYDFEWANKNLFHGAYDRNTSFFGNSEFASSGLPSNKELQLLNNFKDSIPKEVFSKEYSPPTTNGNGNGRENLIKAKDILENAGYLLKDMKLVDPKTNQPVNIEFLLGSPSFERVVAPFVRNLKKLGIDSTIRTVDSSQYIKRRENFDFDIIVNWFTQGALPGNEQFNYWHSSGSNTPGSMNLIGINNKAVDYMVEKIATANNKEQLIASTRALDRILLWNHYIIPQWYSRTHRVIYWNKFGRPKDTPPYSLGFVDSWWIDPKKANTLKQINHEK